MRAPRPKPKISERQSVINSIADELAYQFKCGGEPAESYLDAAEAIVQLLSDLEKMPDFPELCSYPGCLEEAVWDRKNGWMVAPGSPEGAVCEKHHCWEKI